MAIYDAIFATYSSHATKKFLWRIAEKVSFTELNWYLQATSNVSIGNSTV